MTESGCNSAVVIDRIRFYSSLGNELNLVTFHSCTPANKWVVAQAAWAQGSLDFHFL